ncbi:MAG: hypothetical protein LBG31_05755 [Prevotellaceae bacterium]|nr:hypothetical protein [Prevotellaceae bacterium]
MKKIFFLFAMIASLAANATVKVTPISTDYSTQKVMFKVEWTTTPYNNRVWVWIDFCPITGTTPATSFSTATISNPQKTGGNGTITETTARGFFIEYGATNAGTTITAVLSNATGQFSWCAYGSDYPPNATMNNGGVYTLRGTQPFVINNSVISGNTFTGTIHSLTDATGCPGGIERDVADNGGVCLPGLTAVGGYCRDLVADNASTYTGCGYEFRFSATTVKHTAKSTACPSGWHVASKSEVLCQRNGDQVFINKNKFWIEGLGSSACDVICNVTTSPGTAWTYYYMHVVDNCNGTNKAARQFWCTKYSMYDATNMYVGCIR